MIVNDIINQCLMTPQHKIYIGYWKEKFYLTTHLIHDMVSKGRKMFYLTTHSTHFYLRLYGVRHMIKNHSDREIENLLSPHGLLFPISSRGSFICTIPDRIAHTTAFVTPVVKFSCANTSSIWSVHLRW